MRFMTRCCAMGLAAAALTTVTPMTPAEARDHDRTYAVTVTNLTRGQSFTPILLVNHRTDVNLFTLGESASPELTALAEGGDVEPLATQLEESLQVRSTEMSEGLLAPGESATISIDTSRRFPYLSLASMMIPTNDAFLSARNIRLPRGWWHRTVYAVAYDAGTETNDELCAHIPGPVCHGIGPSPDDDGEGFVHVHAGIDGHIGDLAPSTETRDWRNPVAKITIKRVR